MIEYIAHDYQRNMTNRIIEERKLGLFLDLGMGKTIITLTAIESLIYDYVEVEKVLVIMPAQVLKMKTWQNEINKWKHITKLTCTEIVGSPTQRLEALKQEADIYMISRDNLVWLNENHKWDFDMLVIDELSSFKNPSSKRFRSLRKYAKLCNRVIGLTGTPIPNGYYDLWAQIFLLDHGEALGKTLTSYQQKYFVPDKRNATTIFSWKLKVGAKEQIDKSIKHLTMSMTSKDWLKMPEKIENEISIELLPKIRQRYLELEREMVMQLESEEITAANRAVVLNKLLQVTSGAIYNEDKKVYEIHRQKLDVLEEIVDATDKPLLVFYNYQHELDRILENFKDLNPRVLKDAKDQDDWNAGKIKMLVAHPASVGFGLNLQYGSNTIVWFGLTWSLELNQQANARLYRQGQKESVIIHYIVAKDSIDEIVMAAIRKKEVNQDALMEALKVKIKGINYAV